MLFLFTMVQGIFSTSLKGMMGFWGSNAIKRIFDAFQDGRHRKYIDKFLASNSLSYVFQLFKMVTTVSHFIYLTWNSNLINSVSLSMPKSLVGIFFGWKSVIHKFLREYHGSNICFSRSLAHELSDLVYKVMPESLIHVQQQTYKHGQKQLYHLENGVNFLVLWEQFMKWTSDSVIESVTTELSLESLSQIHNTFLLVSLEEWIYISKKNRMKLLSKPWYFVEVLH